MTRDCVSLADVFCPCLPHFLPFLASPVLKSEKKEEELRTELHWGKKGKKRKDSRLSWVKKGK